MKKSAPRHGEIVDGPQGPLPVHVMKGHEGHPIAHELGPVARALSPHTGAIITVWWILLALVAAKAVRHLFLGYRR